ncbi:MAG: ChaN family lipoprotein, partial [Caldimonas sp.]
MLAAGVVACTAPAPVAAWEARLHGDAVVLLGEVHDNAAPHRLRLEVLRRAFAAGWRPAIVMEQFDREHQPDIDRARRERPADAQHVIDLAATPSRSPAGGWNWDFYRPFVALALQYDVPLIAANLSNADTTRIVRGGYGAVFDAATESALGLDRPVDAAVRTAQEAEIDAGHCHALPPEVWPRMA